MTYEPGLPPTPPLPGAFGQGPFAVPGQAPPTLETPIAQDVPCRKCGYNLRGLSPSMRCPECGTAAGYSLQGDLLRYCDPGWVETIARGVGLIVWGVVVIVLGLVGAMIVAFNTAPQDQVIVAVVGGGGAVIGWVMMTVGWWFLTQPDPSGLGEDRYGTARKVIRVALVVSVVSQILTLVDRAAPLDGAARMGLKMLGAAAGIVSVVGIFAQLYYLEKIARRIPDQRLSARAGFVRFALGITYAIVVVISIGADLRGRTGPGPRPGGGGDAALACITLIVLLLLLVFALMYLSLLVALGKAFRESAGAARSSWAAAPWGRSGVGPA